MTKPHEQIQAVGTSAWQLRVGDRNLYFQSVCGVILISSNFLLKMFSGVPFSIASEKPKRW